MSALMLAADFEVKKDRYAEITAYISGLGLFEASINGKKIADTYFDPGESHFGKRVYYVAYDITGQIKNGANAIGIVLGNGQYTNFKVCQTMEQDGELIDPHRYQKNDGRVFADGIFGTKKVMAEIHGVTAGGSDELLLRSDEKWKTTRGPITFQSWYGGEDYDARAEIEGWDCPGTDRASWENANLMEPPKGRLCPRDFDPVKIVERLAPVTITKNGRGAYVFDFGKNSAGFPEIRLDDMTQINRGAVIKMLPCEELDENGFADQRSSTQSWSETRKCEISDTYIVKGSGTEIWHPVFSYHGFRYLEVSGFPYEPVRESITLCRLRADNPRTGALWTDSELINKINGMTENSIENNMFHVFTDCPHIEKLGWLETTHLMFNSVAYCYDIRTWAKKIIRDMIDAQVVESSDDEPAGYVPAIAPEYHRIIGLHRDPNWGGACVLTPWQYYNFYNDISVLEEAYPTMQLYMQYLSGYEQNGLLSGYAQMGDWGQINENTPVALVQNCAYYQLLSTVSKIAAVLGRQSDCDRYAKKMSELKSAFHNNTECYDLQEKQYGNGSQSSCACVLYSDIVLEDNRDITFSRLLEAIETNGYHLSSGEVGLKQVFSVLNRNRRDDVVYKMVTNDTQPSYKYFVDNGLTALPEYWNYEELWYGMVRSKNHAMMGHVREWLVHAVIGIHRTGENFKNIVIQPFVPDGMKCADGSIECGYGKISVQWEVQGNKINITAKVPHEISAAIAAPQGYAIGLSSVESMDRNG